MEPARPDIPDHDSGDAYDNGAAYENSGPDAPGVGPTAALRGRAGGPGFEVPPDPEQEPPSDAAYQSGWQQAQGVWQGSGVEWEHDWDPRTAERLGPDGDQEADGNGWEQDSDWDPRDDWDANQDWESGQSWDAPAPAAVAYHSAPTVADIPVVDVHADIPVASTQTAYAPDAYLPPAYVSGRGYASGTAFQTRVTRPESVVPGTRVRTGAADEMFRAWDSSVREASGALGRELGRQRRRDVFRSEPRAARSAVARGAAARDTARRRRLTWQAARVGVPLAVIMTVGAGAAVIMLTGQPGEMMAVRSDQGASAIGQAAGAGGAFAGYPGTQGPVTVDSAVLAGGTRVAVGNADGHPAIWHRNANGTWSLVSATLLASYQTRGGDGLTSIAHGRDGWVAVGDDTAEAGTVPVVLTSADGLTWHVVATTNIFSTPGTHVSAVAAGPDGYVVVGQRTQGARRFAALWWSPDLRSWVSGNNGGLDGRLSSSSVSGVTATASGFVAVGTHSDGPMIWTSGAGVSWTAQDIAPPAGSSAAKLKFAVAHGRQVVAVGNATIAHGDDTPFAMVSSDAGRTWKQQLLPTPSGIGTVTALTAAGNGFVAVGLVAEGPAKTQEPVTWTSPDGLTWSAPAKVGSGA